MTEDRRRRIRSYVLREGRFTPAQRRAFDALWPKWGIDYTPALLDLVQAFDRDAPCALEIGFGTGQTLAEIAASDPATNYLGIEVHRPGVGRLLNQIEHDELTNVRVLCHDAVDVLQHQLGSAALDGVNIFFPDPWPKKRHHKRRLIQAPFLDLLALRMKPGALLHVATDWKNYAEHIDECLGAHPMFQRARENHARPETKFERRGLKLGHDVWDFVFVRTP